MKLIHNEIDKHLYILKLHDTPSFSGDVLPLLESISLPLWKLSHDSETAYIGDYNPHPSDEILCAYLDKILSLKSQLLDIVLRNQLFAGEPAYTKQELDEKTSINSNYYLVREHFGIGGMHYDGPLDKMICHGLFYFMDGDQPNRSTVFKNWDQTYNIVIPTGYQVGWMTMNNERSLHCITNYSEHKRYGIKFWLKWSG